MRFFATAIIFLSLTGCVITDYFLSGSKSNSGTSVETNADVQIAGERQNKISGTDKKTEIEEINATNAKTEIDNSDKKQTFDHAENNYVTNESGINYWFFIAIIGWIFAVIGSAIGFYLPSPYQKKK